MYAADKLNYMTITYFGKRMYFVVDYIFSLQGGEHHAKKYLGTGSVQQRIRIQNNFQDQPWQNTVSVLSSQRPHLHYYGLLLHRSQPGQDRCGAIQFQAQKATDASIPR